MRRLFQEHPRTRPRTADRVRAVALGAFGLTFALALALPGPAAGQSRSGVEADPVSETQPVLTLAAKKPKKMPQAKRRKIKDAKIKKAREYEVVSGGTEQLVSTIDYDTLGNARSRRHRPQPGATVDETLEVDLVRDVVTKSQTHSSVQVSVGGVTQVIEDDSEADFEYEEVEFEDGRDHLLKKMEMKRQGSPVATMDHAYDSNGRLHRLTQNQSDEPGTPVVKRSMTEFTYDAEDRPILIVTWDNRPSEHNPTEDRVISRQRREYGPNGQVSRIDNLAPDLRDLPPGSDSLLSFSLYAYDANLNLLSRQTWQRIVGSSGTEDILVSEELHVYDDDGNEVETTVALPLPPAPGTDPLPPPAYAAGKRQKTTRTFDNFGNVLTELAVETDSDGQELSRRNRRFDYEKFD